MGRRDIAAMHGVLDYCMECSRPLHHNEEGHCDHCLSDLMNEVLNGKR